MDRELFFNLIFQCKYKLLRRELLGSKLKNFTRQPNLTEQICGLVGRENALANHDKDDVMNMWRIVESY